MMINYCFVTIAIEGKFEFDLIGILFPKLFWPTVRKKMFNLVIENKICKMFEISRIIYSIKKRSKQFLKRDDFFNLLLEVSQIQITDLIN